MNGGTRWAVGTSVDLDALVGRPELVDATVVAVGRRWTTVRARRQQGGSLVAIKLGPPLPSRRAQKRFLSESSVLLRLPPSPHVLPVLHSGVGAGSTPWLAVPWLPGGSLGDRLRRDGPLPVDTVVPAAADAAVGLATLHSRDVLHANLTPSNMLRDEGGRTVLDDAALPSLAPAGDRSGPAQVDRLVHVPPEVLEGGAWTAAGDIWALGSCLFTLLTDEPPWARQAHDGAVALVLAMAAGAPPPLHRPDVPPWLAELVSSCLAVDPRGRPGSPEAVEAWVRRAQPDVARTVAPPSRDVSWARSQSAQGRAAIEGRPLGSSYLLLEPIGAGASGQVWRARRRWDDAAVAVKVLRPELSTDPHAVARFLRERTTLVGLDHPNLVRILDLVAEGGVLAIVMELIEGSDLRAVLRREGPMALPAAASLLAQIAAGLDAIHRAGVVHRDLKPENVLVQPGDRVRVTDFGIARTAGESGITAAEQLVGTAEYLAPELVAGRPLTPAADIYSLGVVAYELLSGHRPFEGPHPAAVLRAHLDASPAPLPSPAWDLIAACLSKEPANRPSAPAVADAMTAIAEGTPAPRLAIPAARAAAPAPQPPVPAPQSGPPASATAAWESPLRRPDAGPAPSAPSRRRRPRWLALVSVLVIAAAGAGVAVALTRSPSQPASVNAADVTESVQATGHGVVTVTWNDVSGLHGFQGYVVWQAAPGQRWRPVTPQPTAPGTTFRIESVAPGRQCFRATGLFQGPLPSGLHHASSSGECVTVP